MYSGASNISYFSRMKHRRDRRHASRAQLRLVSRIKVKFHGAMCLPQIGRKAPVFLPPENHPQSPYWWINEESNSTLRMSGNPQQDFALTDDSNDDENDRHFVSRWFSRSSFSTKSSTANGGPRLGGETRLSLRIIISRFYFPE